MTSVDPYHAVIGLHVVQAVALVIVAYRYRAMDRALRGYEIEVEEVIEFRRVRSAAYVENALSILPRAERRDLHR